MTVKRYEAEVDPQDGPCSIWMKEYTEGDYVTYSDYQKLVAENADLKSRTVKVPAKVYVKDMKTNVVRWALVIDALSDAGIAFVRDDGELIAGTRETPVTNDAIAEIKAQGVDEQVSQLEAEYGEIDDVCAMVFRDLRECAANLRAGRKCDIPPTGWSCTRAAGHDGPCAAVEDASHE